jgi:2-polyprenyl-6-hydroxyphenyl methylase/3-demethylubiquinone-9 3-methyltransferase
VPSAAAPDLAARAALPINAPAVDTIAIVAALPLPAMTPNADPAELQRFSDIAHRWWDPAGAMRPLHELNPLRLDWIDRHAGLAGKRVLDVGCGGGVLSESMATRGAQVTGIDLASKLLTVAELHALESGVKVDYRLGSAEELAQKEAASYDVVTCMELLEHVPDPASTVRACAALVRPQGWVFFSTINRNPKAFAFAILGAEYLLGLLPRGTHEYAKFIRPSELAGHARAAGLAAVELTGMTYDPLRRRFALGADTDVNYLLACRRTSA